MNKKGYIRKTDNGDIMFSSVTLSCSDFSIKWFIDLLNGKTDNLEHKGISKKYQIQKDISNIYQLNEIREGGFVNNVCFSGKDIPDILDTIQTIINENNG